MHAQAFLIVFCLGVVLWHERPEFREELQVLVGGFALGGALLWSLQGAARRRRLFLRRRRAVGLEVLTKELDEGTLRTLGDQAVVSGRLDAMRLTLKVSHERVHVSAPVRHGHVELDVRRSGPLGQLCGSLFLGAPHLSDPCRQVRLDVALNELFGPHEVPWITLEGGWLRAELPLGTRGFEPYVLLSRVRALLRLAQAAGAPPRPEVRLSPAPSSARCPYCHEDLENGEDLRACPACRTEHHRGCFREAGGCTLFGCERAPVAWMLTG